MIRPPYPFPKRWKRIYGESARNDSERRRNDESRRNRTWEDTRNDSRRRNDEWRRNDESRRNMTLKDTRNDSRRRNDESIRTWEDAMHNHTPSTNEEVSEITHNDEWTEEEKEEEFVPIPLFREGEWVGGEDLEERRIKRHELKSFSRRSGRNDLSSQRRDEKRRVQEDVGFVECERRG